MTKGLADETNSQRNFAWIVRVPVEFQQKLLIELRWIIFRCFPFEDLKIVKMTKHKKRFSRSFVDIKNSLKFSSWLKQWRGEFWWIIPELLLAAPTAFAFRSRNWAKTFDFDGKMIWEICFSISIRGNFSLNLNARSDAIGEFFRWKIEIPRRCVNLSSFLLLFSYD